MKEASKGKPPGLLLWEAKVMDMPYKPMVPCRHPGCPNLVPAGQKYCEEHKSLHPEENRSAAARGYNSRWRRESKKFLQLHPLCQECLKKGIATPATVVDHIVPHRGDPKLFWDRATGRRSARSATTGRREIRMRHRRITTDSW
jgi:5-methylcytosine-specific restriction protein A